MIAVTDSGALRRRDGTFEGAKSASIYYQYWQPANPPQAVLILVHGAAEHSGRYERLAAYLVAHGYALAALDHPSHGRSDGVRGHIDRFDDYLVTLQRFQKQVSTDFPDAPLILLGHSLGGLIAAAYLLEHQHEFAGCVLSGPAIMSDVQPGKLQMLLVRLFSAILPKTGVLQLDASGVSRDPAEVQAYRNDPLVYTGKLSARKLLEMFKAMQHVQANAATITLPMLVLHGGEDILTSPEGSRFLDANIGSTDKTLKIYPGLYHEIFNEPEREQVFADVVSWCDRLLQAPTR